MSRTLEAPAFGRAAARATAWREARASGLRVLFGSLVLLMGVHPFLEDGLLDRAALLLLSTTIVLSASYAISATRHRLALVLLLATPTLVTGWTSLFVDTRAMLWASGVTTIVFYVYTLLLVLSEVLRKEQVTSDELLGALSVYILIGLTWGVAYQMAEDLTPGALRTAEGPAGRGDLTYYSFVTLMTVGSGEITPHTPLARSLTLLEAMVGIVFVAVLIARLVGLHASSGRR